MNNKNINEKIKIIMKTKITNNEEKKENQNNTNNNHKAVRYKIPVFGFNDVNQIKENLNSMTIYITQLLDLSPLTRIFLLKNNDYPSGMFAVRDRKTTIEQKYNIIAEQVALDYMRNLFQAAYNQASINKTWEWFINDLNNVTIPNLTNSFKEHLEKCRINAIEVGDQFLNYKMNYPITIKVMNEGKIVDVTSSETFEYTVKIADFNNND